MRAIPEKGLSIPNDIALVGFDNPTWTSLVEPPITVIAQPTQEIGRIAIELLKQRIADPNLPPREVILKGKLIIKGSGWYFISLPEYTTNCADECLELKFLPGIAQMEYPSCIIL